MQQDRYSQMQSLVLDTRNLLQRLASNINSLLVLVSQEFQEWKRQQSQIEQENETLKIKNKALRERNIHLEDMAVWVNGETQPLSNFCDGDEDALETP